MNKFLAAALAVVFASGAAIAQSVDLVEEFLVWEQASLEKARAGKVKWSDHFNEAFSRVTTFPSHPDKVARMQLYSEGVPLARRMEAGKLTRLQYEDELRRVYVNVQSDYDRSMQTLKAQQRLEEEKLQLAEEQKRLAQERREERREAEKREILAAQARQAESDKQAAAYQQQLLENQRQANLLQQQQLAAQRQAQSQSLMNLGSQLMQMGAPRPSPTVTCNTNSWGSGLQTTCR